MLKSIEKAAKKFKDVEEVKKAIRSVQSQKSRLKQQKNRKDYNEKMTKILQQEQLLKEVRNYFQPKKKPVTQMNKADIQQLNYDETLKAIKSIQSKKCNVQHATEDLKNNTEYQKACEIERMLLEHKKQIKPIEATVVKKSEINNIIEHLKTQDAKISTKYVTKLLEDLLNK